jgi:hypothetical protein
MSAWEQGAQKASAGRVQKWDWRLVSLGVWGSCKAGPEVPPESVVAVRLGQKPVRSTWSVVAWFPLYLRTTQAEVVSCYCKFGLLV